MQWYHEELNLPNADGLDPVALVGVFEQDNTHYHISLSLHDPVARVDTTLWQTKLRYLASEDVTADQLVARFAKHIQKARDKYLKIDRKMLTKILSK